MSKYWFEDTKVNDLLRIERPLGSFFLRDSKFENIVFLATGTGITPVKSILEMLLRSHPTLLKRNLVFVGSKYEEDLCGDQI